MMAHLKATAAKLDLPMGIRKSTYNSRLAQEVGLWAETKGKGPAFHDAAFRAYFAEGQNLADVSVLLALMGSVGLDLTEGQKVIDQRSFRGAVDADWQLSRAKGITAVPTFIMGQDRLVGAQSYEVLERMVLKHQGKTNDF